MSALHNPGRADRLETLEEHLMRAAALARAAFVAVANEDAIPDPRDRAAFHALTSELADHASAALFIFNKEDPRADVADPIFGAIERHRRAFKSFENVCGRTDRVLARQEGRVVTDADEALVKAADDAADAAMEALVKTTPTTAKGALAALAYLSKMHRGGLYLGDQFATFAATVTASGVL